MKNKTLYEILYASDKNFILKYFKILDDINLNYCEELKTKKILYKFKNQTTFQTK